MTGRSTTMQGVLWKRRDVFRNRWRPRWFVLHPRQGILTYYLLNATGSTPTTPTHYSERNRTSIHRRRADSDLSSMETIDYDVVPRGSIFLGNATTEVNEALTRLEERLYVFTITDLETNGKCHLACRTSTARDHWLVKIQEAITFCQRQNLESSLPEPIVSDKHLNDCRDVIPAPTVNLSPIQESSPIVKNKWKTIQTEDLTTGIPPVLLSKIDTLLEQYLPFATSVNHPDFKATQETHGVKVAIHSKLPIRRSIYSVSDHHPADYLGLVWNLGYASELEPNMRTRECLRIFNKHTMMLYTAYHPVWPSAPRDFCTVAHWRMIENTEKERTLVYVAFSCPEANKMKVSPSNHVRGTLNVSLQCWSPLPKGGCRHIGLFSVDMNGTIPEQLIQTLQQQQVTIPPRAMDALLSKMSPSAADLRAMDYTTMARAIESFPSRNKPELRQDSSLSRTYPPSKPSFKAMPDISILTEAAVLLLPLLMRYIFAMLDRETRKQSHLEVAAPVVAMVFCFRWVVVRQLLRHFVVTPTGSRRPRSRSHRICRLSMDIAPLLDFMENERQAKIAFDEGEDLAEWRIDHILLAAISRAVANHPVLVERSVPFLPTVFNVDLKWHGTDSNSPRIIPSQNQGSVQCIANFCSQPEEMTPYDSFGGMVAAIFGVACDVSIHDLSKKTSSRQCLSHVADARSASGSLISVLAYVPERDKDEKTTPQISRLDMLFDFQRADTESCESFMKDVERYIQFPELCLQSR